MKISNIDLSVVYNYLEEILGDNSYILVDLIKRVVPYNSKDNKTAAPVPTLAINAEGTLFVNEDFCEKYIDNEKHLTAIFLHELMHQILTDTHFLKKIDKDDPYLDIKCMAANVAMDSRINAIITHLFNRELDAKNAFYNIYEKIEKEAMEKGKQDPSTGGKMSPLMYLLFAGPQNETIIGTEIGQEALDMYRDYYNTNQLYNFYPMYNVVLDYLKKNSKEQVVVLLGDHESKDGDSKDEDGKNSNAQSPGKEMELPEEVKDKIKEAIANSIRNEQVKDSGKQAGKNKDALTKIIQNIEGFEDKRIDREVLKKIAIKQMSHNMLLHSTKKIGKWTSSPVLPSAFTRSDIIKIVCDMPPLLWKHHKTVSVFDPQLVPIYFDVSGSMDRYIPMVLDLILNIDARIEHIWCFSTYVRRHSIEALKKREIDTDGGTCFNAVVQHAVENNFRSIMVITDGFATVSHNGKHPDINNVVTILTDDGTADNWFSKHYNETHKLTEVIQNF